MKTLYFDRSCGYTVFAAATDGKLSAFAFEKADGGLAVGDIYKGRVANILKGMQAAFVECGDMTFYLSPDGGEAADADYHPALPNLRVGDEILVQIRKLPVGKKQARVSTDLTFVGKFVIYMPKTPFKGVSRKICDAELRNNLLYTAEKLKTPEEGLVMRTAAAYATLSKLEEETAYLRNVYAEVLQNGKTATAGKPIFTEAALMARILRDAHREDVNKIVVGTPELLSECRLILSNSPLGAKQVVLHNSCRDMFEETGLSAQIESLCSPRVDLENGAYLVIEKTEALTSIDVNTGKFTGDDSLEQTVYHTNVLAAREIARQVRLRNVAGLVVVDFIDMKSETHRKAIADELRRALKDDPAKCNVADMSPFGLVEFTRRRVSPSVMHYLLQPCRRCGGDKFEKTAIYGFFELRAELLKAAARGEKKILAEMTASVYEIFDGVPRAELKDRLKDAQVYIVKKAGRENKYAVKCGSFPLPDEYETL